MNSTFLQYIKGLKTNVKDFSFLFPLNINYFKFKNELTCTGEPYSIISDIYSEALSNQALDNEVLNYLDNISKEEIQELNNEEVKSLIWIYYFGLDSLPNIYSIFDWEVIDRDLCTNFHLIDPFYDFPEANFIKRISNISNTLINQLLNVLEEDIYDYSTYSVGEYNSDLREEYLDYFENFLKPAILASNKNLKINDKIKKLNGLRNQLELILLDIKLYESIDTLDKDILNRKSSLLNKRKNDLKNFPSKFNTLSNIDLEINKLLEV